MTPKEKAKELFDKIYSLSNNAWYDVAKECALIAVNEIIKEENKYNNSSFYPSKYWQEVKQEIEKL